MHGADEAAARISACRLPRKPEADRPVRGPMIAVGNWNAGPVAVLIVSAA